MSLTKLITPFRVLVPATTPACLGCRFSSKKPVTRLRPRPIKTHRGKIEFVKKSVTPILTESQLLDPLPKYNVYKKEEYDLMEEIVLRDPDYFKVKDLVTMDEMFNARLYFGHASECRNPHMAQYLFGSRLGTDIIDLEITRSHFLTALNFLSHVVYRGGIILFISRDKQNMFIVENAAKECGEYSHCRFWLGGTFTNSETLFGGMIRLPDVVIFLNTQNSIGNQHLAVTESARCLIPTIGIVDSNCDPRLVSYPIPGNDDTPQSIQYFCDIFKQAILHAKEMRKKDGLSFEDENEEGKDQDMAV